MMALVEPPIAMCTLMALSKAAGVRMRSRVSASHTMSTMRRPAAAHMRGWLESAAGIEEAPGSVRPSASAIAIMVAAGAMAIQVPDGRGSPPFHRVPLRCGDAPRALLGPIFPEVGPRAEVLAAPIAAQNRARRHVNRRYAHADGAHDQARRGLVATAQQHRAIDRVAA